MKLDATSSSVAKPVRQRIASPVAGRKRLIDRNYEEVSGKRLKARKKDGKPQGVDRSSTPSISQKRAGQPPEGSTDEEHASVGKKVEESTPLSEQERAISLQEAGEGFSLVADGKRSELQSKNAEDDDYDSLFDEIDDLERLKAIVTDDAPGEAEGTLYTAAQVQESPKEESEGDANPDAAAEQTKQQLNGLTQECVHECYAALLQAVQTDSYKKNPEEIDTLFKITIESFDKCSSNRSPHVWSHRVESSKTFDLQVPANVHRQRVNLSDLIADTEEATRNEKCLVPDCDSSVIKSTTTIEGGGDNIVMRLNRVHEIDAKTKTRVDLDVHELEACNHMYELSAVISHRGNTPQKGHYAIYRKHKGVWYHLHDAACSKPLTPEDVKDTREYGQTCM